MPDNEYRKEVQDKVHNIFSERHEKSTPKLVIEAVVEGMKLYRSFQEDKEKKEVGKGKRRSRHRRGEAMEQSGNHTHRRHHNHKDSKRDDESRDSRWNDHHGRSPERERRRHRDSSSGRHRLRSTYRNGEESRKEKRGRSWSRNKRSRYHQWDGENNIGDPVTEGASQDDTQYQMSGGAGPANALHGGHGDSSVKTPREQQHPTSRASGYQTSWRDIRRQSRSPSRSRGHREHSDSGRRAPTPHQSARKSSRDRSRARSPTRQQKGPDGTPFGSLPKYKAKAGIALGLGDHFMNTYKHIKAEHEGGHRTRGLIEKALKEAMRRRNDAKADQGKQASAQRRNRRGDTRHVQKKQSREGFRAAQDRRRKRGEERSPRNVELQIRERHNREQDECRWSNQDNRRKEIEQSTRATASYEGDDPSPREPVVRSEDDRSQSGAAASYYRNAVEPPGPGDNKCQFQSRPQSPVSICSSEAREATSGASSTIMSHAPLPPPPGTRSLANSVRAALLVSIRSGKKLRSAAPTHQEDEHADSKAETVDCEETAHSHEVEEHEPDRAFRDGLLSALEGRNAELGTWPKNNF